ncbi:MAG TPA: hypothetical protein VJU16_07175, partial [Planctomycetota bacterium]|nr:hypothetical protein [Planctomycetota bacterium]
EEVNQDNKMAWVLHAGDIKNGSSDTSDALVHARFNQYQKFKPAFIFTPGDNEWTDAHRTGRNPLERLTFLRSVFYPNPGWSTGGSPLQIRTQATEAGWSEFVENQLWVRSGVVFSMIHVVGSHNNLDPWTGIDSNDSLTTPRADRLAEYNRRLAAVLAWIDETFAVAASKDAKGVLICMQANPGFEAASTSADRRGFNEIVNRISEKTLAFGKPVVVAHGDSHYFRIDKPLRVPDAAGVLRRLENLTRAETFGEQDVHWVRVIVDPDSRSVFSFEPVVVEGNFFPR